ncbi:MAG: PKD domain-containing protein [Bacteroidales bacterium]|nr:PKD domain-containing protein [Bacteroidales bacterium]
MKKLYFLLLVVLLLSFEIKSQTGTEFWFAPPEVTYDHNSPGGQPIYLLLACLDQDAVVTISQPANPLFNGGSPIVVNLLANQSSRINLTPNIGHLETEPTNTILNTGLLIEATNPISAYYEVSNTNNCDIFALKGANALGYEFYIPLQNHVEFYNHTFGDSLAYASFDIVATQDNTTVRIYPTKPVDGHEALVQYTVTLDRGQTYSCAWTGAGYTLPVNHPSGSVVVSDKPVAITIKDDSSESPGGGCYDLMGDQIVPVNIVGKEYIVIQGHLNKPSGDESIFILATENNTEVFINGNATASAVLFAGETFRYEISAATGQERTLVECTKPVYCTHVTGFGCEQGQAILPPLNCAGSEQISFVRSTTEAFYLNLLIKDGYQNDFTITGPGTATINPTNFLPVPGTGGVWVAAQIQFNTTQIPVDQVHVIENSSNIFSMGIINGGSSSGCRYGYFSEFVSEIIVDAGSDQTICSTGFAQLAGSVSGGATTGIWTSSGTGVFVPNDTDLNAQYYPSAADITNGSVELTLTSTSICFPEQDIMEITINPGPIVDAGIDQSICANNVSITLAGSIVNASGGGYWSGGAGSFIPNNATLNAQYVPTAGEISAGTVTLILTSVDINCDPVTDEMDITFTPAPTANAGTDVTVCANNPDVTLNGLVTQATGGTWSNGTGSFSPGVNALSTIYTPSAVEIANNSVTLTLTTTGVGNCLAVSDNITINFSSAPLVDAGTDETYCANNSVINLNGSVVGATGGIWSGGLGVFSDNTDLGGTYSPTAAEIAAASVTLTLTSTGNGTCNSESSTVTFSFTGGPTVNAGTDQTVCANNENVTLNGSYTVATGGSWSGGAGAFSPNNTTMNAVYTPTPTEISTGTVSLTLTTTGNGNCLPETDNMTITITPAPVVNAGADLESCVNNPQVTLTGSVLNAGGGMWSNGAGVFSPSNIALGANYTPSPAEISAGTVNLTLTSTGNGNCLPVSDVMTINIAPEPVVNAGPDQVKCSNNSAIQLAGSVSIATGGQWTGGLGIFLPNNNALNAVYYPSATEIANGFVNLTLTSTGNANCNANTDDVLITFTNAPTVNAGSDQAVCANNAEVSLNGSVTIATGGIWSGGNGTFTPGSTDLASSYLPSAVEIAVGSVTLTLTTTGNGDCVAETDEMTISIAPSPVVNAGTDLSSCENNPEVTLNGNITYATGGVWSGGTGVFNPSASLLNAVYTPSAAEIAAGTVNLILTSTGNGSCTAVTDQVTINIGDAPVVNAGTDFTVCANNPTVVLNGSVSGAAGGVWSGGLGVFNPNNSVLNSTYTPSASELAAGSVSLTLSSTGNGNCNSVTDIVVINYTDAPTVDAGLNQYVCANNPVISLSGIVSIASGGIWSGGLGTFSPNNTSLVTDYTPTPSEIENGVVTLTLTSTGNGDCLAVSDQIQIIIDPAPYVNAGPNQTVCVDNLLVNLNGLVSGPITSTGIWTSSGTGSFVPNASALNAAYLCSSADSTAGFVTLYLTSTNNDDCFAVTDSMEITILPAGTASAGLDVTVCANNPNVLLSGTVSGGATGGTWSTSGTGVFVPSVNALNATYVPSAQDTMVGSVTLTLTATSCNLSQDQLVVTITPAPFVDAGANIVTCVDDLEIELNGIIHGGTTTGQWSSTGTGNFVPNVNTLDATYIASAQDSIDQLVTLYLTSTNNGNCLVVIDSLLLSILPAGIVDAGFDQTYCSNNAEIELNGSVSGGASEGMWSTSGTGVFIPSATALDATYIPSSADTAAGSVTLVLSATNSCNFAIDVIQVNFSPAPTSNAGSDQTVCGNNADVILNGAVTIAAGGLWSTSGSGTFLPSPSSLNATYVPSSGDISSGEVVLILTTTGNGGCNPETDSMRIFIDPAPVVWAGYDQQVCQSADSTMLLGNVYGATSTGVWTTTGTGTFSDENDLGAYYYFSPSDVSSGSVTLTLTSTNNGDCLEVNDQMVITFGDAVFAYAGEDIETCASNLDINLTGFVSGGSTTGSWTTNGTGTFTPDNLQLNTLYTCSAADSVNGSVELILTSTNNGGCLPGNDTLIVSISPLPMVNAGDDIVVCTGTTSINLATTLNNAEGVIWSSLGSGTFVPNDTDLAVTYIPSEADSIIENVIITLVSTGNGVCGADRDTIEISFETPLIPGFTYETACLNSSTGLFDNTILLEGTIDDWIWSINGGSGIHAQDTAYTFTATGLQDVSLTLESSLGCSYSITREIYVNPLPEPLFTSSVECFKDAVEFTDESEISTGNISSWTWDFGDSETSNLQNASHLYANAGNYDVTLTVSSDSGCISTTTNNIDVYSRPRTGFTYTYNCENVSVEFTDTSSSAGNPVNFWNWTFGDGNSSAEQNPINIYPSADNYSVQLISGNSANCSDTAVLLLSLDKVIAAFGKSNACPNESITFSDLTDYSSGTAESWMWTFGDGTNSSEQNPIHAYSNSGIYSVSLVVTTAQGCIDTISENLQVYERPQAGFIYSAEEFLVEETIEFTDQSTGAISWDWNFGDSVGNSSIQNPLYIYYGSGIFEVSLAISNQFGCTDTARNSIVIEGIEEILPPKVPNTFTPNDDGINDIYYVRGGPFTNLEFKIFNKWGQLIFESFDQETGWDGTYKGQEQPVGVYVYTIKATTTDGQPYSKTGNVTIIR